MCIHPVGAGQAEPALGVGSQVLPIPSGEYDKYSGESSGLLDGGTRKAIIYYYCSVGEEPSKN